MKNYNISTDNIKQIVNYCEQYNYFDASTVFLARLENTEAVVIVTVYADDYINSFCDTVLFDNVAYKIVKLPLTNFYKLLLSRDLFFGEIVSNAIFIKDDLSISSIAQLSAQPIKEYNLNNGSNMEVEDSQSLFEKHGLDELKNNFSMLYMDNSDLHTFTNRAFFPLSKFIKQYLGEASFMLQTKRRSHNENNLLIELTYFVDTVKRDEMLLALQKELYAKISDYKLHKIIIPYQRPSSLIDLLPPNLKNNTYEILAKVSEDVVSSYSEKPLEDKASVTLLIYYLLTSAVYYFNTKEDFLKVNDELYAVLLPDSVSPLTHSLLSNNIISSIKDKAEREYNSLAKKIYPTVHVNYSEFLRKWDSKMIEDDDMSPYFSMLSDISNNTFWESVHILQYPPLQINLKALFFIEYYKHVLNCFDIPAYYKAFIPFIIKYLVDNEI